MIGDYTANRPGRLKAVLHEVGRILRIRLARWYWVGKVGFENPTNDWVAVGSRPGIGSDMIQERYWQWPKVSDLIGCI
ncbi:hypothetical protein V6667_00890 [Neisseria leonii]|uniref:hypothetical protein n=1 Tax=Neisseria leonii TaxID=2995413 RepID=UPI0030CACCFA